MFRFRVFRVRFRVFYGLAALGFTNRDKVTAVAAQTKCFRRVGAS